MKNFDLNALSVTEMNESQKRDVNGGVDIGTLIAIVGACIYVYNNFDDFKEGFQAGWDSK